MDRYLVAMFPVKKGIVVQRGHRVAFRIVMSMFTGLKVEWADIIKCKLAIFGCLTVHSTLV